MGGPQDTCDYKIITNDQVRAQTATKAADAMEQVLDLIRKQGEMNALLRGRVEALEGMVQELTAMMRTLNREMRRGLPYG
jgi:hypothetical protein